MIPVKLIIEGLYSYKEKQTIDFNALTNAGLFGIFGAVGSGKSSILEAIMLALFAESERLSMRGERAGLIHLQSSEMHLDFTFKIGATLEEEYRAVYHLKRRKKDFTQLESPDHFFYKKEENTWVPLAIKDASEILGIKLSDFKRTIIIPQGKFREFVELKDADRSEMLKDLFQLNRFDLFNQVRSLSSETSQRQHALRTIIETLGDVSEEAQSQLLMRREEVDIAALRVKEKQTVTLQRVQEMSALEEKYIRLLKLREERAVLEKEKENVNAWKDQLSQTKLIRLNFSLLVSKIEALQKDRDALSAAVLRGQELRDILSEKLQHVSERSIKLKSENERKAQRIERIGHLKKLIQVNQLSKKKAELGEKWSFVLKEIKEHDTHREELEKKLEIALQKLAQNKENLWDREEWNRLSLSIEKYKSTEAELSVLTSQERLLIDEIAILEEDRNSILSRWMDADHQSFDSWKQAMEAMVLDVEMRRDRIQAQLGLEQFVPMVKNGEPCPLCGSLEHPRLAKGDHDRLAMLNRELQDVKDRYASLLKDEKKSLELAAPIQSKKQLMDSVRERQGEAQFKQSAALEWMSELKIENIQAAEVQLNGQEQLWKAVESGELEKSEIEVELKKRIESAELSKMKSIEFQKELSVLTSQLDMLTAEIYVSDDEWWKKYEERSDEEIQQDIDRVQSGLVQVEQEYTLVVKEQEDLTRELATAEGSLERDKTAVKEKEEELNAQQRQLETKLTSLGLTNDIVLRVLRQTISEEELEQKISSFEMKWNLVISGIEELQVIAAVQTFLPADLHALRETTKQLAMELEQLQKEQGSLAAAWENIKKNEKQKLDCEVEMRQLETREMGLRELEGLFKGKGFVSYISNFYLQDLCRSANVRFMELTRQQMSIEVDENNNFYIKDFLNDGKLRLLKTLSGGQMFQASLCLALALSERVKYLHQSEKSFFFLDEGFGSLDKASLAIVFETLKSLRKENRVVGIISHVEELQQEMDVCLKVRLDKERGSLVTLG